MYSAGRVKIVPATITPDEAPIDCIMTFWPRVFFFPTRFPTPTAMIAIGIAASKT